MADVNGEDPDRFHAIAEPDGDARHVHPPARRWRKTPTLESLSDGQLERDLARERLVHLHRHAPSRRRGCSAPGSRRCCCASPRWVEKHGEDPWFPRVPAQTDDVVEDFDRFAQAIARHPHGRVMRDRHFMPQWIEAAPDRMPYSRIYDTSEIGALMGDLERHLRANGYTGELQLKSSNETPLRPIERFFTPGVREALQALYEADYRELGYDELIPPKLHPGDEYPRERVRRDRAPGRAPRPHRRPRDARRARAAGAEAEAAGAEGRRRPCASAPAGCGGAC